MIAALWILVGLGALAFASVLTAVCLSARGPWTAGPADCIVVLGCHVWMDGRMSNALLHRCEAALAAWESGLAPTIAVCGGQGRNEPAPEADGMRDWLLARGGPEAAILADRDSVNTRANMAHARALMEARGLRTAAVCTSDYHMRRALWIARDAGLPVTGGVPSPSPEDAMSWVASRIRETCSWTLYALRRLLRMN